MSVSAFAATRQVTKFDRARAREIVRKINRMVEAIADGNGTKGVSSKGLQRSNAEREAGEAR